MKWSLEMEGLLTELNHQLFQLDKEEAQIALRESGLVNDQGLSIVMDGVKHEYAYEDIRFLFYPNLIKEGLILYCVVFSAKDHQALFHLGVDNLIYNLMLLQYQLIINKDLFDLFENERKRFVQLIYEYDDLSELTNSIVPESKYTDNNTQASNPGRIGISKEKWNELPRLLQLEKSQKRYFKKMFKPIRDFMMHGCAEPAIVMSVKPLLISAYSGEMDAVVMLVFPSSLAKRYHLEIGTRLIVVNTYRRWIYEDDKLAKDIVLGPHYLGRYRDFNPIVALFLADDEQKCAKKVEKIPEEDWKIIERLSKDYREKYPQTARNGFFYLYKQ
ncbi:MAG: hypothetical protein NC182_00120 [Prevotella sp.]|nr:hypothetical protein [Staphylococcus sp.]MCM1349590.1 hypothetical protein [Prevotella sp.]